MCLSIIPGLGQLYKGQPGRGLLWFVFVVLFLAYAMPIGILLWIVCAGNAALAGAVREEVIANSARRHIYSNRRRRQQTVQPPGI
jgi:TM2 domain-containing membrane protein YozV